MITPVRAKLKWLETEGELQQEAPYTTSKNEWPITELKHFNFGDDKFLSHHTSAPQVTHEGAVVEEEALEEAGLNNKGEEKNQELEVDQGLEINIPSQQMPEAAAEYENESETQQTVQQELAIHKASTPIRSRKNRQVPENENQEEPVATDAPTATAPGQPTGSATAIAPSRKRRRTAIVKA